MKKLLFLLLVVSGVSFAQSDYPRAITLSWLNTEYYVDGTLIDPGDLTEIRVECFRGNDATPTFTATVPATGEGLPQSETFANAIPQPGTYSCVAYSIIFDGTESEASGAATKKYTGKPLPPQQLD